MTVILEEKGIGGASQLHKIESLDSGQFDE